MTTRTVSPQEALGLIEREGYAYIDVRATSEFDAGHPRGAYNVPIAHASATGMQPNPDFLAVVSAHFAPGAKLVLGCLAGARSMRAAATLEAAGFTALVVQRAGWGGVKDPYGRVTEPGWSAAGLPSASGPDAERSYAVLAAHRG